MRSVSRICAFVYSIYVTYMRERELIKVENLE